MPIKLVLIALVSLCISSCRTVYNPNEAAHQNLIQQYHSFYKATIGQIMDAETVKKWMTFDSEFGDTRIEGVHEYRRLWCSSLPVAEMKRRTFNIAIDYCYQLGGDMHDRWCRSKEDKPLFFMTAGDLSFFGPSTIEQYCHPNRIFSLVVSTSEGAKPEDWNNRVKKAYGYTSMATIKEQERKAKDNAYQQSLNRMQDAEANATLILARGVGRRACKNVGQWMYSGIVNKIEDQTIHVY
ncbi:MAG TPA: hypothetical protein VGN64_03010, partial [Dyadobacter sp.]|nr:hypothetical protein [Dyadobacter sp.]